MYGTLNQQQKPAVDDILLAVRSSNHNQNRAFAVIGPGGCGKTLVYKCVTDILRKEGKIVLPVATSGIAACLLPGGITAHSQFTTIPLAS